MNDMIQLLPDAIANQIAAGEVVQRPASALKELLENAIDAQAQSIQVVIKDAGKSLIQVIDDGLGMSITDARMCFERHATSKIRKSDDLFNIRTHGFRGEAMASIAAVAQVELKTKRDGDELGTLIQVESSTVKKQEPIVYQRGTSVSVKNLFCNVPARRNFLKSNAVETKHLVEEFQRVALAYPKISFSFYQNDMELFKLAGGKLSKRIVGIFGKQYRDKLIVCQEESPHINIHGYIGKPEQAKKSRGEQYFFVNNRFIKSNYLGHAVSTAFESLIGQDQHPFYVLFLDIDPKHIDINVHPTKTEIKFDDERTIYGVVRAAVKQALGAHHVVPTIDFSLDVNFTDTWSRDTEKRKEVGLENNYRTYRGPGMANKDSKGWEQLFQKDHEERAINFDPEKNNTGQQELKTFPSKVNSKDEPLVSEINKPTLGSGNTFQVEQTYIVTQTSSGLLIFDQQATHQRILYERYASQLDQSKGASQQCLFPQNIRLSPADFALVMDLKEELSDLGFQLSEFGQHAILINGVPADIHITSEKILFEELLEQFKHFKNELSLNKKENLARSLAKKTSIKRGDKLQSQEMENLAGQLFACQNPNYSPEGSKTFIKLDLNKIDRFFYS
ncbi:DNA mismatch repair endonuclease MutL [Cyclobacterium marinum]|uniref:DNA mismatch repair protein MutL n=1 Tax=Cyclobacterium marinum (strain ATCC 25205 / DSM 745 / LMG 13164 / NCIMB 1802) TaxID=880070 RepID=G0IW30_CYCMS|nr:DNA mismatch repair endonuclease MutL [Cyclobacterium marinum]AEL26250.1 DNA mismatch repair protein mutL [Cyclobacterium marinum DSM 745]MBI0399593.1 DNA mismatch repair endonuclease MutL [Cyclobacterium marinum]MBR9773817.1 DNA mismatch repair endonuclease MutL [Cytophagales bacterium]|tara:strand:+ start:58125 stop:59978 length:1854 start_codon:yes stop_codon:yes gene_type:complete